MHVQGVQKYCFSLSNMQIFGAFVAVVVMVAYNGELTQPRRRRQQGRHKFAYLIVKNNSCARFARAVFIFDIS